MTAGPDNPLEWTEYGASGAASVETLHRIIPAEHLWPIRASDPYWIWHKEFGAYGADNWMASAEYLQLFGELPDLETTVRCSQFVQAEGLRYANQAMRRFKWHRSGCASWTYNEPWPNAAHGCVVEYYGRPKMAYYYTRSAFTSVDVSAEYPSLVCRTGVPFPLKLFVTSDRSEAVKDCRLAATVIGVQGRRYDQKSWRLDLAPDATDTVGTLELNPPAESAGSVLLVQLHLCDSTDGQLSTQTYTFGVVDQDPTETSSPLQVPAVSPDGRRNLALLPAAKADTCLRALLTAPTTELEMSLGSPDESRANPAGDRTRRVTVHNRGKVPALFIKLDTIGSDPTHWHVADNYFTLLPGEWRELEVYLFGNSPSAETASPLQVRAKAWNSAEVFQEL